MKGILILLAVALLTGCESKKSAENKVKLEYMLCAQSIDSAKYVTRLIDSLKFHSANEPDRGQIAQLEAKRVLYLKQFDVFYNGMKDCPEKAELARMAVVVPEPVKQ